MNQAIKDYQFCELDVKTDRIEFEKELYKAYKKDGGWYFNHLKKTGDKRLIPPIPYEDLKIVVVKKNNHIAGGMLSHINHKNPFLLEKMGFILKKEPGTCEGLSMFLADTVTDKVKINVLMKLGEMANQVLIDNHTKRVYAAPQRKYVNIHFWVFDFDEELEMRIVEEEERCLLIKEYRKS